MDEKIAKQSWYDYLDKLRQAQNRVDMDAFYAACAAFESVYKQGGTVFVCGNGGSAAIANHTVCDHGKLIATNTSLRPKVVSLCQPVEMITAIANDFDYSKVFSYQLEALGTKDDLLLVISGSGNSPNVKEAIKTAKSMAITSVAMTGFDGGFCRKNADISLHVECDNYGVAEDVHQSLMQAIAQLLRVTHLINASPSEVKF